MTLEQHLHLNQIPNRYHFIEIVEEISRNEKRFSLMLMDVMRFSDVSAAFDHKSGDEVLLKIANHICKIFPDAAAIGRLSGDIFGIVYTNATTANDLRDKNARLISHFKAPLMVKNTAFIADFNVGAAIRKSSDTDANTVISLAEAALKKSKSNRHVNFTLLSDDSQQVTGKGLALKADLTRALNNNELELYFQPKVDLNTFEIIGGECLLRWNHPLDGVVFPSTLLKAAESYNMMNELGYWTLESAFSAMASMSAEGFDVPVSVNLSPTQLYDPQLLTTVRTLVQKYDVQASMIEIELTEDVALTNSLLVKRQLDEMRKMGIAISMDDFGKGYSNLSFIRDLELSAIKIDKAFVLELSDSPVNSAIVQATKIICDAKGCETYAEGIENMEQLNLLRNMGITKGQGFFFSQAVPYSEFISLMNSREFVKLLEPSSRNTG
ncbi:bifunctional diguanylate cyclase/phosphodiesterase [Glaciecola sp. XM2]|uniref:putative bifunctional diguanylate cyclase/phosphodiesterase n=1 Tax=Glaciecola sp. XM2 TaxID=1914931 RepID=UPI001BDF675D|nr:bifunctional diguanylate cyclase/phosphodiesterase [Glaciecola sp. XM2]MBT1449465.1 bifunctional diguanylate cyclase/phosphodiesterase [Glaciecola sp. XM2]